MQNELLGFLGAAVLGVGCFLLGYCTCYVHDKRHRDEVEQWQNIAGQQEERIRQFQIGIPED